MAKQGVFNLTQEQFLTKVKALHGHCYDYSQSVYAGVERKVTIICPIHSAFDLKAGLHIRGKGCPQCAKIKSGVKRSSSVENFIKMSQAKHGVGTYDYSQVVYKNHRSKVLINCEAHGGFYQQANAHAQGRGCPKCNPQASIGTAKFITRSQAKHGVGTYDYSQVVYVNAECDVTIICPKHGQFAQRAGHHMNRGSRCPRCFELDRKRHWVERAGDRESALYFINFFNSEECFYKVGITVNSINQRYSGPRYRNYEYQVLTVHRSKNALAIYEWERAILETFAYLRYTPKQNFGGATECFSEADPILAIFPL